MNRLDRWLYYHWLVVLDIWRLRRAFLLHVVIVSGICLPILILGALKRGHVAQLREDLVKSVSGRQVIAWSAQNGDMLQATELESFTGGLPDTELLVPDSYRAVLLQYPGAADRSQEVTVYATLPGDPMLAELGVASPADRDNSIVLPKTTAEAIGVKTGDNVTMVLRRKHAGHIETETVEFSVSGVFAGSSAGGNAGFVHLSAIEDIERFVRGNAVQRWDLPAFPGMSAADRYAGYLVFCKNDDTLRDEDFRTLSDRALDVSPVSEADANILGRLLKPDYPDRLTVYRVMARQHPDGKERRLAIPPADLTSLTLAEDDIAIPWNEPREQVIGSRRFLLVGLSFPERRWLRGEFQHPALAFSTDANASKREFLVRFPEDRTDEAPASEDVVLQIAEGSTATLDVLQRDAHVDTPTPSPSDEGGPDPTSPADDGAALAVVPAQLLAHLDALERGEAIFDPQTSTFPPVPIMPTYDKFRVYARSIDGVPTLVETLQELGYGVTSEFTRIKEIHEQDDSLALLVNIVTWGVLLFGILTVSIVLVDSTDRKSRSIGIMRIMGVSSAAVSYMVMLRASMIGICAAGVAAGFAGIFCSFLSWAPLADQANNAVIAVFDPLISLKPVALATLDLWQDRAFLLATVACSILGSFIPAYKASHLDPFDAVAQSRSG